MVECRYYKASLTSTVPLDQKTLIVDGSGHVEFSPPHSRLSRQKVQPKLHLSTSSLAEWRMKKTSVLIPALRITEEDRIQYHQRNVKQVHRKLHLELCPR
jgi:hypothetical protein